MEIPRVVRAVHWGIPAVAVVTTRMSTRTRMGTKTSLAMRMTMMMTVMIVRRRLLDQGSVGGRRQWPHRLVEHVQRVRWVVPRTVQDPCGNQLSGK